jgi:hypothetical protein
VNVGEIPNTVSTVAAEKSHDFHFLTIYNLNFLVAPVGNVEKMLVFVMREGRAKSGAEWCSGLPFDINFFEKRPIQTEGLDAVVRAVSHLSDAVVGDGHAVDSVWITQMWTGARRATADGGDRYNPAEVQAFVRSLPRDATNDRPVSAKFCAAEHIPATDKIASPMIDAEARRTPRTPLIRPLPMRPSSSSRGKPIAFGQSLSHSPSPHQGIVSQSCHRDGSVNVAAGAFLRADRSVMGTLTLRLDR